MVFRGKLRKWRKYEGKGQVVLLCKAEAQLAYELQAAKIQQRIRQEEIQIQVGIGEEIQAQVKIRDK